MFLLVPVLRLEPCRIPEPHFGLDGKEAVAVLSLIPGETKMGRSLPCTGIRKGYSFRSQIYSGKVRFRET